MGEDERISVYEASQASTINAADQLFEEEHKGSLVVGKLADLIVVERNPLEASAEELKTMKVVQTYREGQWVWQQ